MIAARTADECDFGSRDRKRSARRNGKRQPAQAGPRPHLLLTLPTVFRPSFIHEFVELRESRANLTSLPSLQGLCAAAYWTPITGAHEVRGAIRDRWAALGWERGSLGYPVSDETNEVDGSGRLSLFEHGAIPPA